MTFQQQETRLFFLCPLVWQIPCAVLTVYLPLHTLITGTLGSFFGACFPPWNTSRSQVSRISHICNAEHY